MKGELFFTFFVIVFLTGFVSASINVDNSSSVYESYNGNEFVSGSLKVSFDKEVSKNFVSEFEGGIGILDLLNLSGYKLGADYTCSPISCEDNFISLFSSRSEINDYSLDGKKLYGFKIGSGSNVSVRNLSFSISSDASFYCKSQLAIDLFADNNTEFENNNYVNVDCPSTSPSTGCFSASEVDGTVEIADGAEGVGMYCEKIKLPAAPAYRVGAEIIDEGSGTGKIEIWLYKVGMGYIGYKGFEAGFHGPFEGIVGNGSLEEFDAYVCVRDLDNSGNYNIRSSSSSNSCGAAGTPPFEESALIEDYEIYARPLAYGPVNGISFDKASYKSLTGKNLVSDVNSYLKKVYGQNCSEGCVIPFELSGISQKINLDNFNLNYISGNSINDLNSIFELSKSSAKINFSNLEFNIENMEFVVPNSDGDHIFNLCYGGCNNILLSQEINVLAGFDFNISPRLALLKQSTVFRISDANNITSTIWNFGDGGAEITSQSDAAEHKYDKSGEYFISVKVITKNGESNKRFKIIVGDPKTSAEKAVKSYTNRINNLESTVSNYSSLIKGYLESNLEIAKSKEEISRLTDKFNLLPENSGNDTYIEILEGFLAIDVPETIYTSSEATGLPGEIGFSNIDVRKIAKISNVEDYGDDKEIRLGIIDWMSNNYNFDVEFKGVSRIDGSEEGIIVSDYILNIKQVEGADSKNSWLIINYPSEKIKFPPETDYENISSGEAVAVSMDRSKSSKKLEFLIESANPDISNLGIYISPVLSEVGVSGKTLDPILNIIVVSFDKIKLGGGLGVVLVFILVLYIILQTWYKNHYEKHLFKNPNELYNVVNYIYNSRVVERTDEKIRKNLEGKKWTDEQITYAFKKIDGKRTGMWEIPLFKFIENKKVRKELEKKQGQKIDTRFIKRRNY